MWKVVVQTNILEPKIIFSEQKGSSAPKPKPETKKKMNTKENGLSNNNNNQPRKSKGRTTPDELVLFNTGNPNIEIIEGVIHLFRERTLKLSTDQQDPLDTQENVQQPVNPSELI